MARVIADALGGDLDVVLVHKIGAPGQPELAIGSIDEHGHIELNALAADLGVDRGRAETLASAELEKLRARRRQFGAVHAPIDPAGRLVIIVDDGIATGSTVRAAIKAVRARKPARIVVAVGVAPRTTVQVLSAEADEVVCLQAPTTFLAVGQFFDDFSEVTDEEAAAALRAEPRAGANL